MSGPLLLAVESSATRRASPLVEDGRRIHSNVVASQVALHAPTGGIVPEVAARAHLRWIVPVLDEALETAGATMDDIDAVAVTYGPGLAGSLLVGINFAKTLAWAHGKPLVPVNHLEGHVYAGWLLDPGEAEKEAPPFPLVALVVSGGHTFLVEMRDHLDYRLLGTTVDDAAGEAFDKVGRLLGLGLPGRARDLAGGRRRRRARPRLPTGLARRHVRPVSFSGLKTAARRIVAAARADAGLPADEREGGPLADRRRGRARLGVPGLRRRRARRPRRSGPPRRSGARGIVLGGGVAANAALRARIAGEAEARGVAMVIPRPGLCTDNGAMIGAAGRPAAGGRRSRRPGPRRAPVAAARPMTGAPRAGDLRLDPRYVQRRLREAGLRPRHNLSQNFLADIDVLEGILLEADPAPERGVLEIGPGARVPDRRAARRRRGGDRRGARPGARRACSARRSPRSSRRARSGSSRATRSTRTSSTLVPPPYDVVANIPYHITSPILHRLLGRGAAPGAPRADGPARGRGAGRRAARAR